MQNLVNNDRNELTVAMNRAAERVGLQQIQMFTQKGQFTRKILDAMGEEHIRKAVIELERQAVPPCRAPALPGYPAGTGARLRGTRIPATRRGQDPAVHG